MESSIWGPSAWMFLHSVTFTYPVHPSEKDKRRYKDFFEQLCYVLPCKDCCLHYQKELTNTGLEQAIASRDSLTRWLVDVHNNVNERLGKRVVTYKSVKKQYESYNGMFGGLKHDMFSTSWRHLFLYTCVLTGSCYLTYHMTQRSYKR
jgi:hypothetical protein